MTSRRHRNTDSLDDAPRALLNSMLQRSSSGNSLDVIKSNTFKDGETVFELTDVRAQASPKPMVKWINAWTICKLAVFSRVITIFLILLFPVLIGRASTDADFQHLQDQLSQPLMFQDNPQNVFISPKDPYSEPFYIDAPYTYRPTLHSFFASFPSVIAHSQSNNEDSKSAPFCSPEGFELFSAHQKELSSTPTLVSRFKLAISSPSIALAGFSSWDGMLYQEIAQFGYHTEKMHAFYPLLPACARLVARFLTIAFPTIFASWCVNPLLLLSAILVNNSIFILAAVLIYLLSLRVIKSQQVAYYAACVFAINPASVFYSAAYSESLFAFLSLAGMYVVAIASDMNMVRQHTTSTTLFIWNRFVYFTFRGVAVFFFFLAACCRSNGAVLFGFLLLDPVRDIFQYLTSLRLCQDTLKRKLASIADNSRINNPECNSHGEEKESEDEQDVDDEEQALLYHAHSSILSKKPAVILHSVQSCSLLRVVSACFSAAILALQLTVALLPSSTLQMMAYGIHCGAWASTFPLTLDTIAVSERKTGLYSAPFTVEPPPYCFSSQVKTFAFPVDSSFAIHSFPKSVSLTTIPEAVCFGIDVFLEQIHSFAPAGASTLYPSISLRADAPSGDIKHTSSGKRSRNILNISILSPLPAVYSSLQSRFWGLGIFKYYQFKQIPNFFLALPMLLCVFFALVPFFRDRVVRSVKKTGKLVRLYVKSERNIIGKMLGCANAVVFLASYILGPSLGHPAVVSLRDTKQQKSKASLNTTISQVAPTALPDAVVHVVYMMMLWLVAIIYMHIQVSTRFLSACPALYWFLGSFFVTQGGDERTTVHFTPQNRLILVWCALYTVVGCIMFSTFLPWT